MCFFLRSYVRNDPVNKIDPDGRLEESWWAKNGGDWWEPHEAEAEIDPFALLEEPGEVGGGASGGGIKDWWLRFWYGINTNITQSQRDTILDGARGSNNQNIFSRISGDCLDFLNTVFSQLGDKVANGIGSVTDLISEGLSAASFDVYGRYGSGNSHLASGGTAFAFTYGNTIYLGENFFDPSASNSYNAKGGDQVATIIHELFHLASVGRNGRIEESSLDSASQAGSWGDELKTRCGPGR